MIVKLTNYCGHDVDTKDADTKMLFAAKFISSRGCNINTNI